MRVNEILEGYSFEGICELAIEKLGEKFLIDNIDVLWIHHMVNRKLTENSNDSIIRRLMNSGYDSNQSIQMVQRYRKVEDELFEYTTKIHQRLNHADRLLNPVVRFEQVEDLHLGIVKESNGGYSVLDISTGKQKRVASFGNGINWGNSNFSVNQMNWIKENYHILKNPMKGVLYENRN